MSDSLFPAFEIPDEVSESEAPIELKYPQSVYFDFGKGDFLLDGRGNMVIANGHEAYMQWCQKIINTERFACLSYSTDIGTEMSGVISLNDRAAIASAVEKTITEALMINPLTEYLRDFQFRWLSDELSVSFIIKGKDYEEEKMGISLKGG